MAQVTVLLKPNGINGKDAVIDSRIPNTNNGNSDDFIANAWTNGGENLINRSLIQFDLAAIPVGSNILSAKLSLYGNPTSSNRQLSSSLTGSNRSLLQRITSAWVENSVTWNNQPATTTVNQVVLHASTSNVQNYINVDVTRLIQDMINQPQNNFGFMLRLETEELYRCLLFASSDNMNSALHPKLEIVYNSSFTLGPDINLCSDQSVLLDAGSGKQKYLWNTGATTQSIKVSDPGKYWVNVLINNTWLSDTILVINRFIPTINLGKDTTLCKGTTLLLQLSNPGLSYKWNTGATTSSLLVNEKGTYWVEVFNGFCVKRDSIKINYEEKEDLSIDKEICGNNSLVLDAGFTNATHYEWQDGTTKSTFNVSKSGVYTVKLREGACNFILSFNVKICLKVPNVITPNNDGFNDTFFIQGVDSKEWKLELFNRWGQLIYRSNNYENDWTGTNSPDGVYYYKLTHSADKRVLTGWLEKIK
ncbi:hypothetical protein AAE02nite_50480 [Adhaeribacter aerolatus]|uniref:Carbohydrate-binding module family 96 domain-containing protein n=2 Tax=Adhaeribacter aerolatus TaxID=670289 RepID=A0A512B5Z8_9BACT|nr:hypothetical protein AAE02nite_50480 [Adhaeribacter aerolatus]